MLLLAKNSTLPNLIRNGRLFLGGALLGVLVFVLVFVLLTLTVLIASFSSIRSILGLKPAEVLHGR